MLNDATGFKKGYLAAGYTDLRRGMEGLATIVQMCIRDREHTVKILKEM